MKVPGMNSFSCSPFPCLPPVASRLSPILEVDEKFEQAHCKKIEVNNSSQDTCEPNLLIPHNLSSHRISHKEQNLIESSSGRRVESVEIIKQKYINNDIQDLPRLTNSPVRYGRCYRSRSSKFNLGSKDIRSQINKITRRHSVTLGLISTIDKEINNSYRCRKYDPSLIDHSDADTIDQDEFEQELLALVDKSEEDFHSNGNKGELTLTNNDKQMPKCDIVFDDNLIEMPKCDIVFDDNLIERRFKDYDINEETKEAFWRGFLQGLKRSEKGTNEMYKKFVDMIDCQLLMNETTKDPCLDARSHLKMIETNQDVTHKFLSAWEKGELTATSKETSATEMMRTEQNDVDNDFYSKMHNARNSESVSRGSSEPKLSPVNTLSETQNSKSEIQASKSSARSFLVMSKTDIHFDDSTLEIGDLQCNEETSHHRLPVEIQRPKQTTPRAPEESRTIWKNYMGGTTDVCDLEMPKNGTIKVFVKPKQKADMTSKTSTSQMHANGMEDDMNMFQLAQKRLQSSASSSVYQIIPDKPKVTQKKEKLANGSDDIFAKEDFDGWSTTFGPFTVQDNLRLSSSELLHPVDSIERFELSKQNSSDANSENLTSLEQTHTYDVSAKNQSQAGGPLKSSDKSTTRNSPFLGSETLDPNGRTFETNAFKARRSKTELNPFLADVRNTSDLVKLRLTNSSCSSPTSNKNNPISMSRSLNIHKKFISDLGITNSIDVSENLAKQLKGLSKDCLKQPLKSYSYSSSLKQSSMKQTSMKTKPNRKEDSYKNLHKTDIDKVKRFNEICLPQIISSKVQTSKSATFREKDDSKPRQSESFQFPPISGTCLLDNTKAKTDNLTDVINSYQHALGSIQVRAGNCSSPFAFDKQNPENLKVLARPLPHKHGICSTCGGITDATDSTNKHDITTKFNRSAFEETKTTLDNQCGHGIDQNETWDIDFDSEMKQQELSIQGNRSKTEHNSNQKIDNKTEKEDSSAGRQGKDKKVNIVYKDKHIQLKCEVTVTDSNDEDEPNKNKGKTSHRINEMAAARHRERMECPIMKETRIYGKKKKQTYDMGDSKKNAEEIQPVEITASSPYLEYCKRREKMRANKQDLFHDDFANFISDTRISNLAGQVRKLKRRTLPVLQKKVIPKNKSNDELKRKHNQESKFLKSRSLIPNTIQNNEDSCIESLIVTSGILPKLAKKSNVYEGNK